MPERDFYPYGIKSISGVSGVNLRITSSRVAPGIGDAVHIPPNPARKYLMISICRKAGATDYVGEADIFFIADNSGYYVCKLNSGDSLLVNEYTLPWCGAIGIQTEAVDQCGFIDWIEGSVE